MHQCCIYGRLPAENVGYLDHVLLDVHNLPKPKEVAKRVHFTNAQREQQDFWTVPPVDLTKAQLAKQRREKDRLRKILARRKAHVQSREAYRASVGSEKPWVKENKSERTYYRHRAKALAAGRSELQMAEGSSEHHI